MWLLPQGLILVVVTTRSDTGGSSRKIFMTLGCECSGTFRPKKPGLKRNDTTSRNCQCPFKLRGRSKKNDETWKLTLLCGLYNYDPHTNLIGMHLLVVYQVRKIRWLVKWLKTG